MTERAQKVIDAAHRVVDGGVPLGKLIREGKKNPMSARVNYEYAAVIREAVNELQYYHFGDGEDMVVSARALYELADELEAL
jgi:hypothetical protein